MSEFVLPDRRFVIVLDDGDMAGAEISAKGRVPLHVLEDVTRLMDRPRDEWLKEGGALFLAEGDPRWNLADSKGPIPLTAEGWDSLGFEIMGQILAGWFKGLVQLPSPLPLPSSDGTTSKARRESNSRRSSSGRSGSSPGSPATPATP